MFEPAMQCSRCRCENPESARTCRHCGATVSATAGCARCGAPNPATARRCFACNAPLAEAGQEPPFPDPIVRQRVPLDTGPVTFTPADDIDDLVVLRRDYEKLRAAYSIAQRMALDRGLDGLLELVVDTAIDLLGADCAAILLVDDEHTEPVVRVAKQRGGGTADVTLSRTIMREVLAGKVGIISADAGSDARFEGADSIQAAGIRSAMCVPLVNAGRILGVFHCDTLLATGAFDATDLELFTTIANEAAVAVQNTALLQRVREETKRRVQLQRFFSPGIVDQVLRGELEVGMRGELRTLAISFLDIRGFTRLSERLPPAAVVELLNGFFEEMVDVLFAHGGTLDKYVGDQLMALFGAPTPLADAPLAAVRCALAMTERLATFNARQRAQAGPTLEVGVGIHAGNAVCGVVGSSKAGQYTAIGDTVNVAARLCAHAAPGQIVVSEGTWEQVRARIVCEALPPLLVKGKDLPLRAFNVTGLA